MIFFNQSKIKEEIDRQALGIKNLLISKDIECGGFSVLDVDQEKRQFELRKGTEEELASHIEENGEQEVRLLTDRISPVKNLSKLFKKPTRLEITFMGDLMLVDLKEGALFFDHPDIVGETLMANIKMDEIDAEKLNMSDYTWQTVTKLKDTFKRWCKVDKPEDYIFVVDLCCDADGVISYKPVELYDISLGEIEKIIDARKVVETKRKEQEVKKVMNKGIVEDEYEDEYEDLGTGVTGDDEDDEEYDGYYE